MNPFPNTGTRDTCKFSASVIHIISIYGRLIYITFFIEYRIYAIHVTLILLKSF